MRGPWYIVDIVLFGAFFVSYAGFWGIASLTSYMDGLSGGPKSFGGAILCGLPVVVLLWFFALLVRMLTAWLTHIRSWRRLVLSCALTLIGLAAWVALPFL